VAKKRRAKTRNNQTRPKGSLDKRSRTRSSRQKQIIVLVVIGIVVLSTVVAIVANRNKNNASSNTAASSGEGGEVTTPSKLKYIDEVVGTGASPQPGQRVTVDYLGTLENGRKFDSSYDRHQPFTFQIGKGSVIKGWDEGVMTMKVGGKRKLIIPPDLGYGAKGQGSIPPNSTLIFEVELHGIN
jgi:FKBP-type peptidyl-prolyl cis-trans isomerase